MLKTNKSFLMIQKHSLLYTREYHFLKVCNLSALNKKVCLKSVFDKIWKEICYAKCCTICYTKYVKQTFYFAYKMFSLMQMYLCKYKCALGIEQIFWL